MPDNFDNNNSPDDEEPSGGGGYRPLKHLDESLFPNNDGDFASSFMQPRGPASQLHTRPSAANPPPWEDPAQAWRYVDDDRVWTGESFVVSRRTQPDTRIGRANPQTSGFSTAAVAPQDPAQMQAPRGLHGPGVFDFIGQPQAPVGLQQRGLDSFPSLVPGSRDSVVRGSPAAPRKTVKPSAPSNNGQFVFTGWNDEAKRELFMWKVKRKKGYTFFLHLFPGETVESLHEAFKEYKYEGERLFNG
ncbi:hypothetical protein BKA58DRAFT_399928 [Alternaria rosae]|uniref:uncharacterized protein n=1 Tax=Alternaria rosae TaxID=1187941 RepID=UPI001E8E4E5A|nr:uncharacterized protein BKA58DRAFT_399928 [Alternaria rosae]KAH6875762.1 hypothetical protein BKA58DRAFT_399928 [Alternaria rosae]